MAKKAKYVQVGVMVTSEEFNKLISTKVKEKARIHGWRIKKDSMEQDEWTSDIVVTFDVRADTEAEARKILKQSGENKVDINYIIYSEYNEGDDQSTPEQ